MNAKIATVTSPEYDTGHDDSAEDRETRQAVHECGVLQVARDDRKNPNRSHVANGTVKVG